MRNKSGSFSRVCKWCDKEFTVRYECSKKQFCSYSCARKFQWKNNIEYREQMHEVLVRRDLTNNPSKRPEVAEKIGLAMSKRMKENNPMDNPESVRKLSISQTKRWKNSSELPFTQEHQIEASHIRNSKEVWICRRNPYGVPKWIRMFRYKGRFVKTPKSQRTTNETIGINWLGVSYL